MQGQPVFHAARATVARVRRPASRRPAPLLALAVLWSLFVASSAFASGSFKLRSTTVNEVSGGWHVYCEVGLPKPPPIAHTTLKFQFTKTAVYERDLVDGHANPVINRQALVNQNPSVESLEVDFSDASGTIFKVTHFDFSITRVRGYEAGEYKLQLRTSDGVDIGSPTLITLNGDNPVVDRRAMSFDVKNPGIKKIASGLDAGAGVAKTDDSVAAVPNNGAVVAAGMPPPFLSDDAFKQQPEELKDHPKGCGCDVPGTQAGGAPLMAAVWTGLGLSMIVWRKRRSRSSDEPS